MNAPLHLSGLALAEHDWSRPCRGLSIPAGLRAGMDRPTRTVVKELSTTSFSAQALNRMPPGMRCWLSLPGLAAKQAEVIDWQGCVVTCRFAEKLSPLILDSVVAQSRPLADR